MEIKKCVLIYIYWGVVQSLINDVYDHIIWARKVIKSFQALDITRNFMRKLGSVTITIKGHVKNCDPQLDEWVVAMLCGCQLLAGRCHGKVEKTRCNEQ